MSSRLLVAIPAWNEAETIAGVLQEVRAAAPGADIVVIDDRSEDRTAEIALGAEADVLQLSSHAGVGGAMRTAFRYARRKDYDFVIQVDADGQHDPAYIPLMVKVLHSHSVVVGARFAGVGDYRVGGPRKWAMRILARVVSRIAGTELTDATSGFRGADRRAIALFAERYPAEYLGDTVESLVIAARAGLSIAQVPVEMRQRQGGRPSQGPITASLYFGRSLLALGRALTKRARRAEQGSR